MRAINREPLARRIDRTPPWGHHQATMTRTFHNAMASLASRSDFRGPRKIATDRQAPRVYLRMIPLCSRFDSVLFTPKTSAIASYSNFSRSPLDVLSARYVRSRRERRVSHVRVCSGSWCGAIDISRARGAGIKWAANLRRLTWLVVRSSPIAWRTNVCAYLHSSDNRMRENGLERHARAALWAWRYRLIRVQWDSAKLRESTDHFSVAFDFFGPICLRRNSGRFPRIL
jgi:hypothetical protein